jgi:hypothetical protein
MDAGTNIRERFEHARYNRWEVYGGTRLARTIVTLTSNTRETGQQYPTLRLPEPMGRRDWGQMIRARD